jgi:hypothetical protein
MEQARQIHDLGPPGALAEVKSAFSVPQDFDAALGSSRSAAANAAGPTGYEGHAARQRLTGYGAGALSPLFRGLGAAMSNEGHQPPVPPRRPFWKFLLCQRRAPFRSRPPDQFRRPRAQIGP